MGNQGSSLDLRSLDFDSYHFYILMVTLCFLGYIFRILVLLLRERSE